MKSFRPLAFASALLCLLLASCIDGREEIWLNADGSGRADLFYDVPATAARFQGGEQGVHDLIESVLKDIPSHEVEVVTEGSRMKAHVRLAFQSVDEITSATSLATGKKMPSSLEHLAGQFQFTQSWRTVDFTRTISPGKALPTAFIPVSEFRDRKLTYILHLPVVPTESNAMRTEDEGRTLIWESSVDAAIREPIVVHFKGKIPIPAWIIAAVVALLAVIALVIFRLMRRKIAR